MEARRTRTTRQADARELDLRSEWDRYEDARHEGNRLSGWDRFNLGGATKPGREAQGDVAEEKGTARRSAAASLPAVGDKRPGFMKEERCSPAGTRDGSGRVLTLLPRVAA